MPIDPRNSPVPLNPLQAQVPQTPGFLFAQQLGRQFRRDLEAGRVRRSGGIGRADAIARMGSSLADFQKEINASKTILTQKAPLTMLREVSKFCALRIIGRQPVLSGLSKGNWQVTVGGSPPNRSLVLRDPEDAITTNRALAAVAKVKSLKDPVHITNNVNYIIRLESGWSKKAPQGMVAVTLQEARTRYRRVS